MHESVLEGLPRVLRRASKSLLVGFALITSALLLRIGAGPQEVEPPGIPFRVPGPVASAIFLVVGVGSGWFAWMSIRQAINLMRRLEFDLGVDPAQIKSALAGCSLISTSIFLTKTIALAAALLIALLIIPISSGWISGVCVALSLSLPYWAIHYGSIRNWYLNPDNWSRGGKAILLLLRWSGTAVNVTDENKTVEAVTAFHKVLRSEGVIGLLAAARSEEGMARIWEIAAREAPSLFDPEQNGQSEKKP